MGLAVLLVRHASRDWENGARNRYLVGFLIVSGAFFVLQFLFGSSLLGVVDWPTGLFVIEFVAAVRAVALRVRALHDPPAQRTR